MRQETKGVSVGLGFDTFPSKYTCDGADVSPPVSIRGLTTPYFALILDDPDAPRGTFTHWLLWNASTTEAIPENVSNDERPRELPGAVQGTNTGGSVGYSGPCPPRGRVHRYILKVYGLDDTLDLLSGATREDLEESLKGNVRQYAETMAKCGPR